MSTGRKNQDEQYQNGNDLSHDVPSIRSAPNASASAARAQTGIFALIRFRNRARVGLQALV
jgi:hypothetical protein